MKLETQKKIVNKSAAELFDFLADVKNFEKLMPENISKFEVLEEDKFLFALKGMPEIVLKMKEKQPHSKLVLGAASDKLPFTLTANINSIEANKSEANLVFEGEFNAMMGMMIKGPITSFINTLTDNMANV
ncbi:SRPBCC family protein [Galbibacter pacificus]|uniref:SRPBCC family protein n=1 Tax=Galbibacter pacificus TaxID=2996052 RepID=A0ABT6FVS6_9FLAO|nr:SRPBCC family protein [Galbibacter pacificus]MDG3583709.1 SRPBCC family protein [Galbibacter pacificus]MDG3587373.1 SRPBCC family protein [Galbibacter pacificus]